MADKKIEKETKSVEGGGDSSKVQDGGSSITPAVSPRPNSTSPRDKWKLGAKELLRPKTPLKANGSAKPDLIRNDSLTVPGNAPPKTSQKKNAEDGKDSDGGDKAMATESRRSSARSVDSKASNVDFARLQNAPVVQAKKEEDDKAKNTVHTDDMYIRSVIPYLPQWLAVLCLMLNVFIPGSGTMISGFSIFCCGKPRVQSKEGHKRITICVNTMVGGMQLLTVPFMLVGWFWGFVWGVYMLILAAEHKEEEKQRREKELQAKALTALNANLRPWTLMRS